MRIDLASPCRRNRLQQKDLRLNQQPPITNWHAVCIDLKSGCVIRATTKVLRRSDYSPGVFSIQQTAPKGKGQCHVGSLSQNG